MSSRTNFSGVNRLRPQRARLLELLYVAFALLLGTLLAALTVGGAAFGLK